MINSQAIQKLKVIVKRNSLRFGIFCYLSAVVLHYFEVDLFAKSILILFIFTFIFGLKTKIFLIFGIIVFIIGKFYMLESLYVFSTNVFVVISLTFLAECQRVVKGKISTIIDSVGRYIRRVSFSNGLKKIETIIVEP